jgi:hypothetical protein
MREGDAAMSAADWLSNGIATAAFLFSVASFYVSLKGERPRLKITCHTYLEHEGYGPPRILVRVVNVGRRPVMTCQLNFGPAAALWDDGSSDRGAR